MATGQCLRGRQDIISSDCGNRDLLENCVGATGVGHQIDGLGVVDDCVEEDGVRTGCGSGGGDVISVDCVSSAGVGLEVDRHRAEVSFLEAFRGVQEDSVNTV
ncbi:unnamed protein product [Ixodes pacificus]